MVFAALILHSAPGPLAKDARSRHGPLLFIVLLTPQEDTVQADCWWPLCFCPLLFSPTRGI